MFRAIILTLLISPALSTAVQGQTRGIAAYWREVSDARSIADARAVERPQNTDGFRDRDIASGLLKLREYELTYDRATALVGTRVLQHAVDVSPRDPWAHFALGMMLERGPDTRQRTYRERNVYVVFSLGTLAAIHAPQELRKALDLDPAFSAAAIELGQTAIDFGDRAMMREAFNALDRDGMTVTSGGLLMQSQLVSRLGGAAEAAKLAELASVAGYDFSVSAYRRASALFYRHADDKAAARAYFEGVDSLTAAGADEYYASISLILAPDELAQWRGADLNAQRAFLRKFWDMRAALAGVTVERRLSEHFHRLAMLAPYRAAKVSATPTALSLRSGSQPSAETDNATLLNIMRHGDPSRAEKFKSCAPGWDTLPVPMQPSLASCQSSPWARSQHWHNGACPPAAPPGVRPDPLAWAGYLACKAEGGVPNELDLIALRGFTYAATKQSVKGESYYPAYATPIAFTWEAYQFRGRNTGAEIVTAVGLMSKSVPALTNSNGALQAVVTVTLADTTNNAVSRSSTPFQLDASGFGNNPDSYLLLRTSTEAAAASSVAMRIAVENPAATAGAIAYGSIDVDPFPRDSLTLSDVILSPADAHPSFERGTFHLALAPGRAFKATELPTIYYEIYGVEAGANITTTINVHRIRGKLSRLISVITGSTPDLSLKFAETIGATHAQFGAQTSRILDLKSLEPGAYTMTITVTDTGTSRTAIRNRLLVIQ